MNVIQLFRNKKTVKRQRTQEEKEQFLTAYFTELYKQNDADKIEVPYFLKAIDTIIDAHKKGDFDNFLGFYMEGPYLNPAFGCDQEKNAWRHGVFKEDYLDLIERSKDYTKVWCIAPEREGIEEFVLDVKKIIPNCVFSVAHSEATPEQVEKFIPYGLKIATHHTNATGTIEHYSECRGVCVDEAVNYNKEIYAELICDRIGAHVVPYMQRLVRKIKGDDRLILISDQFISDGPVPEGFEEATAMRIIFPWLPCNPWPPAGYMPMKAGQGKLQALA